MKCFGNTFSDGDSGTPSISVQAANLWYNFRDTYIVRFVADGCRKNLPLSDAGESPLTQNPYESPSESGSLIRRSFTIRPFRRTVFAAFLVVALLAGLFVPTIELFKGTMSLGRAPLWLAYVGLAVPESWPSPFLIIAAHWIGAFAVAWIGDRLLNVALQTRA